MNLTRLDIKQVKPEMPGDLEEIAGQLLLSARKPERQKVLKEISSFRVRIAALRAKMK
jgi:hypothetical protein